MSKASKKNTKQKDFYNTLEPTYLEYEKNVPYAQYLAQALLSTLPDGKHNLLEVGAGQGRFTFELAKHVGSIHATDVSSHEIKLFDKAIKKQKAKNITTDVQDLLRPYKKKKQYDHIVGYFLLHHIERGAYDDVVRNMLPLLKKGGRMSFVEPNTLYPGHLIQMMIYEDMHWEIEKQIYTDYYLKFIRACKKAGMTVRVSRTFGFVPPPVINKWPWTTKIERVIEAIPVINLFLCPFLLVSVEKN